MATDLDLGVGDDARGFIASDTSLTLGTLAAAAKRWQQQLPDKSSSGHGLVEAKRSELG